MSKKKIEDMTIDELKQRMDRCAKDILRIISSASTPEMRHELATDYLKWLKEQRKFFVIGEQK